MIDIRKLKELVRLMVENELTEIDLHDQQETVTIKRGTDQGTVVQHQPVIYGSGGSMPIGAGHGGHGGGQPAQANAQNAGQNGGQGQSGSAQEEVHQNAIESPMVGTFYMKPSPDAKPFVSVGDNVGPDTVVCLVEAMKVFNEIKAEQSGVVEKILVKDGDPVEFGQPLIVLK